MNKFTDTELARMQDTQVGGMMDTCVILDYSNNPDYGEEVPTWSARNVYVDCGLNEKMAREIMQEDQTIVKTEGELRLPIDTKIDEKDHIQILTRFGQPVQQGDLKTFALAGLPRQGPSGLLIDLIIVEPGENR